MGGNYRRWKVDKKQENIQARHSSCSTPGQKTCAAIVYTAEYGMTTHMHTIMEEKEARE